MPFKQRKISQLKIKISLLAVKEKDNFSNDFPLPWVSFIFLELIIE